MRRPVKKRIWSLFLLVMLTSNEYFFFSNAQFPPGTLTASGIPLTAAINAPPAIPNLSAYLGQNVIASPALQALSSLPTLPASSLQGLQSLQQLQALQGLQGLAGLAAAPASPFSNANTTFIPLGQVLIPTGKEVIRNSNNNNRNYNNDYNENNNGNGNNGYGSNCGNGNFYNGNCGGCCGNGCCGGSSNCNCCGGMDCNNNGGFGNGRRKKRSTELFTKLFELIRKRKLKNFNKTKSKTSNDI